MEILKTLLSVCVLLYCGESAKILGIIHGGSFSHQTLGLKLLKPLAERGHHITMVSTKDLDPPPNNWTYIFVDDSSTKDTVKALGNIFDMSSIPNILKVPVYNSFGYNMAKNVLEHPKVQELIHSNETFDLIIVEKFYNEAFLGFVHKFKCPYILLSTMGSSRWVNEIVGNPGSPVYVPDLYLEYTSNMNFWQRLYNTIYYVYAQSYRHFVVFPQHQTLMDEHFPGAKLEDLLYNASLLLLNSHISIQPPVPRVPNMIDIGGYHVDPPKELPQDLQSFLDKSTEGVIYFSLGSVVPSKDMTEGIRNAILRTFSKLKQKVIWKWENETLANQPPNVKLGKWFPQQDILAHPNIALFITHCGLLSTIEAVDRGVPLLGLPIFAEQLLNAAAVEYSGYGLSMPFTEFAEEKFENYLTELLNNPKYRENVRTRSKILKDQQNTPLEKAIFWVEYVIRHKGAPQLRSVTLNLRWYQYFLLDVIAFIILILAFVTFAVIYCIKGFRGTNKSKVETSKKYD